MDLLHIFPHLNAVLNTLSGFFLILGFYFIRSNSSEPPALAGGQFAASDDWPPPDGGGSDSSKRIAYHRKCMLTASIVSVVFLISYLSHHSIRTYYLGLGPTRFAGEGISRPVYFTILTSHTVLAALVTPFVVRTLWLGLRGRYDKHKRLARLVFPVWLYVSITGVLVYLMLYQIYK